MESLTNIEIINQGKYSTTNLLASSCLVSFCHFLYVHQVPPALPPLTTGWSGWLGAVREAA